MGSRVGGGGYAESRGGGVGDGTGGGRSKNGRDGRDGMGNDSRSGGGLGFGGGRTASVIGNRFGAPSASAQAAAKARNAPMNGPLGGMNPNHYGGRRTTNPTSSYEMSMHNMMALGNKLAPGGLVRSGLGIGPEFRGYTGQVNGPGDYDGPNRFGTGLGMTQYQPGQMTPALPKSPAIQGPQNPGLGMTNVGAMNFGYQPFNGMQGSQWTRPGYSFVGGPSSFPGKPFANTNSPRPFR